MKKNSKITRAVLCIRPDEFQVSVERRLHPALKGRALLLCAEGRVNFPSAESMQFGVRSGMPLEQARELAPHAIILPARPERYLEFEEELTRHLADRLPVLEKGRGPEFYADLSEIGDFAQCSRWLNEFRQLGAAECGMPLSMGLAASKWVASAAASVARGGEEVVLPGRERRFLAPLPLENMQVQDAGVLDILRRRGISRIGQLAEVSPGTWQQLLGKTGMDLWQKANGICHGALTPYRDPFELSAEVKFPRECRSVSRMQEILGSMAEKLSYTLRKKEQFASSLRLRIRYTDFHSSTREMALPPVLSERSAASRACDLLRLLFDPSRGAGLIALHFAGLQPRVRQMNLFAGKRQTPASGLFSSQLLP